MNKTALALSLVLVIVVCDIVTPGGWLPRLYEWVTTAEAETDGAGVAESPATYRVSAQELYTEFEKNEVATVEKYRAKVVSVTGDIREIGVDNVSGRLYVALKVTSSWHSIRCYFDDSKSERLSKLEEGSKAAIKGMFAGEQGFRDLSLVDCVLQ